MEWQTDLAAPGTEMKARISRHARSSAVVRPVRRVRAVRQSSRVGRMFRTLYYNIPPIYMSFLSLHLRVEKKCPERPYEANSAVRYPSVSCPEKRPGRSFRE